MNKVVHAIEVVLFRARWLLAPLYIGLVGTLVLLAYRFVIEFIHLAQHIGESDASTFTLDLLALLDLTLLANLILMVIFAGYENFVSRIDVATESADRPHWMGTIDFSGLKIKLIGSLEIIRPIQPRRLPSFSNVTNAPALCLTPDPKIGHNKYSGTVLSSSLKKLISLFIFWSPCF